MTDLEMTRLCAEAMGWRFWWSKHNHWNADGPNGERWGGPRWYAFDHDNGKPVPKPEAAEGFYDFLPLTNDAQAMALVKMLVLDCEAYPSIDQDDFVWVVRTNIRKHVEVQNSDLNRAIVECVAKMQGAKNG